MMSERRVEPGGCGQQRALDAATATFLAAASPVLTEAVLDRLDTDDADPVERLVDELVEQLRTDLTEAIYVEVSLA